LETMLRRVRAWRAGLSAAQLAAPARLGLNGLHAPDVPLERYPRLARPDPAFPWDRAHPAQAQMVKLEVRGVDNFERPMQRVMEALDLDALDGLVRALSARRSHRPAHRPHDSLRRSLRAPPRSRLPLDGWWAASCVAGRSGRDRGTGVASRARLLRRRPGCRIRNARYSDGADRRVRRRDRLVALTAADFGRTAWGAPVRGVCDDLLAYPIQLTEAPDAILCMGDTITHLADAGAVESLVQSAAAMLRRGGSFVVSLRDYSVPLLGDRRFIPVRDDDMRLLNCFLEYEEASVVVNDILHERIADAWTTRVSHYRKLRLATA
jgi:SAM-dependent methyltransferase